MNEERDRPSSAMPDEFDRLLGQLDGLPGVVSTKPAIVQLVTPVLGNAETFVVRTIRQKEESIEASDGTKKDRPPTFTVFLEHVSKQTGHVRLVLPSKVADLIARQRDALTEVARRRTAKRVAATRKAAGWKPTFGGKRGRQNKRSK
jgi:hypothetical protein